MHTIIKGDMIGVNWFYEVKKFSEGFDNYMNIQFRVWGSDAGKIRDNIFGVGRQKGASRIGCTGRTEAAKWQGIYRTSGLNRELDIRRQAGKDTYRSRSRNWLTRS
jgi:hypothetical protein